MLLRFHSILLGDLNLHAVVYHVGSTIDEGHYLASVKHGDTWYQCNDKSIMQGANCDPPTIPGAIITPYLLIYEKNNAELSTPSNISISVDNDENNDPETLRWLDKDTIQLEILKYRRSELNSMWFITAIGAVYIKTNEYPYLVILLEPTHAGSSTEFGQLRVWYYKCKP